MTVAAVGADKKGGKRRLAPAAMFALLGASLLAACAPVGPQTVEPGVTPGQQPAEVQEVVIVPSEEPTETPTDVPTETPEPTAEPTATPAPTETPTPTEVPIPTEVTRLLQGTGFEAVSVGAVTQQNGEAQAYFDEAGDMVAVVNLSTGELERTRFDVNGTEVYVFPNTRTIAIRTEEEAINHISGRDVNITDLSHYEPKDNIYHGFLEVDHISITQVDMEEWRIVQPDTDEYAFPVARVSFNYLDRGVVKRGILYMRNTAVYQTQLNRSVALISKEEWARITLTGISVLLDEKDLSRIEGLYSALEYAPFYGETTIAAWSVRSGGSTEGLKSEIFGETLILGNPSSPYIPQSFRNFK